jgi:hypothetical protein
MPLLSQRQEKFKLVDQTAKPFLNPSIARHHD